jgi:hypothetical protein
MNIMRKALSALGGIFLAALLIAALAPKATRGIAAALVLVTNTSANPVPTVSAEAHNSFDANGLCQFYGTDFSNGMNHNDFCLLDPIYTVPAGQIAVIEHASGRCIVDVGGGIREARVKIGPSGGLDNLATQFSFLVPGSPQGFLNPTVTNNNIVSFAQSTKTYVAAGGAIDFEVFSTSVQSTLFDSCELDISGYLVSQ